MKEAAQEAAIGGILADVVRHAGHGAWWFDRDRQGIRGQGPIPPFCRECLGDPALAARCRATYEEAAANALASAEPFHYTCWAGLLFVAVAIAPLARCRGCVAAGGFRAEDGVALPRLPLAKERRLRAAFAGAPAASPSALRALGAYIEDAAFAAGINSVEYFRRRHAMYLQQRAIAEHLPRLSPAGLHVAALTRRAEALVADAARLDDAGRRRRVAAYLAAVLQAGRWDLARLKAHLRVPLALLTRDAVLRGEDGFAVVRAELRSVARLDQARTVDAACFLFLEMIEALSRRAARAPGAPAGLSERVVRWIEDHAASRATLAAAARDVGASVPGIIRRVRRDTGKTFHQLLIEIRLAEAKRLLAASRLDLSAIALECGFCDLSHFTRQFRRATQLTPGRFRALLNVTEDAVLGREPDRPRVAGDQGQV